MTKKFDIYNKHCASHKLLEIIGSKWTILIIELLSLQPLRFLELQRQIGGISKKVLTQTLKNLELNGLILRQDYAVLPLKVEYSLTPLGKSLSPILSLLTVWTKNHIAEIIEKQSLMETS